MSSTCDKLIASKLDSLDLNETESSNSEQLTVDMDCSGSSKEDNPRRRSLRKRIRPVDPVEKRRCITKPTKRTATDNAEDSIDVNIYLSKNCKRKPLNLETIFEEPKVSKNEEVLYVSAKRQKRFILFEPNNKGKIKKRQEKIKKYFGRNLKRKRATMEALVEKLNVIE